MAEKTKEESAVRDWVTELEAARSREKEWRDEARKILDIYTGKKKDEIPFNILYSNTETLQPALYNVTPRPVVQRRHKDEDPLGKLAASVGQRTLAFLLDTNSEEYEAFDDVMGDALLDTLLPGRGAAWVKYDAKIGEAQGPDGKPLPVVMWETVCFESLRWDRWLFGHAKKWKQVPWIAREYDVTEGEALEKFGKEKADKLTYATQEDSKDQEENRKDEKTDEQRKTARVYEVWDKDGGRKVRFIAPTYLEGFLKVEDDPLELTGFFPTPRPLRFVRKANDLRVTPLYVLYENQAKELNRITVRINKIVEALKVRGVYDTTIGTEIEKILEKDDNALIPAENVAALQEAGLEKAIWLMPIEKLVTVLQQLLLAREQCKQVIYEITGIADILRGSSKASETLGAQEIKTQWAGLRLKRLQKDVQVYVRDLLRIALEIAAKKLSPRTFAAMTGLQLPTQQEKTAAIEQMRMGQLSGQQPNPQTAQVAQSFSWDQILETLRNDLQRAYHVDIETNSTVDAEATEDKALITEAMTAVSQLMNGLAPLIEQQIMPFDVAKALLLGIVRRFRFGPEVEDHLRAMQAPPQKQDPKQELQAEKSKMDLERKQMQVEKDLSGKSNKLALDQMRLDGERKIFEIEKKAFAEAQQLADAQQDLKLERHMHGVENTVAKASMKTEGRVKGMVDSVKPQGQAATAVSKQLNELAAQMQKQLAEMQTTLLSAFGQQSMALGKQLSTLAQAVTSEKEIVRGPDGRATGVRIKQAATVKG